jgi:hypothetical protein
MDEAKEYIDLLHENQRCETYHINQLNKIYQKRTEYKAEIQEIIKEFFNGREHRGDCAEPEYCIDTEHYP